MSEFEKQIEKERQQFDQVNIYSEQVYHPEGQAKLF
jgi:hypothetical protein